MPVDVVELNLGCGLRFLIDDLALKEVDPLDSFELADLLLSLELLDILDPWLPVDSYPLFVEDPP